MVGTPSTARAAQTHEDVLHATDTALRLVNQALGDLGIDPMGRASGGVVASEATLRQLAAMVVHANGEVTALLELMRSSRAILDQTRRAHLHQLQAKFAAVTATTETAAVAMLDGLERALAIVATLERDAVTVENEGEPLSALRDELYGVINLLQFHDITSQQLGYAASVIGQTEHRLEELATIFTPVLVGGADDLVGDGERASPAHLDPNALSDKRESQAFADALFDHR